MRLDSIFGFKTQHPRNGIQDPSRINSTEPNSYWVELNGAEYR